MGVGHSVRFFAGQAAGRPAESFVVEVCQRRPGRGQVIITGHTPGPKMRVNVLEARAWAIQRCADIAAVLGCTGCSKSSLASRLHDRQSDLHVHFQGGWNQMDFSLYGGAMGVAMVSLMTQRLPRTDVAVVGALTVRGQLLPSPVLKQQEVEWMQLQGFRALVAPGDGIFMQPETGTAEMASRGIELVSTRVPSPPSLQGIVIENFFNDLLPVLPRIFGLQQ